MKDRILDYYMKDLDLEARQTMLEKLKKITPSTVKCMLEEPDNYPTYRNELEYTDDDINQIKANVEELFRDINDYMHKNERNGFFDKPDDTYRSAKQYEHLLKKRTPEELKQMMGASLEDYIPKKYIPKQEKSVLTKPTSSNRNEGPSLDD